MKDGKKIYTNNERLWVPWCKYFHEMKDEMFHSTRLGEWVSPKVYFFPNAHSMGKNVLKSSNWKCGFHSNGYGLFQKLDAHPQSRKTWESQKIYPHFSSEIPPKNINHFFSHKGKEDMEIPRKFNLTVLVKKWEFPLFFLFLVQIIEFPNFIKFSEFPFFWKKKSSLGIPRSLTKNVLVFVRGCADYNSFAIVFSKQVISLPSQTCTYRVKVAETSYVVRADIIEIQSKKQQFYNLVSCRFFPPWNTFAEVWTGECLSKI